MAWNVVNNLRRKRDFKRRYNKTGGNRCEMENRILPAHYHIRPMSGFLAQIYPYLILILLMLVFPNLSTQDFLLAGAWLSMHVFPVVPRVAARHSSMWGFVDRHQGSWVIASDMLSCRNRWRCGNNMFREWGHLRWGEKRKMIEAFFSWSKRFFIASHFFPASRNVSIDH